MPTLFFRRVYVSCARKVFKSELSTAQNRELYGSDFVTEALGQNFAIEAAFVGPLDFDLAYQSLCSVAGTLDHHYLNHDLEYFNDQPPTLEHVAKFVFLNLQPKILNLGASLKEVRVVENSQNWATSTGNESWRSWQHRLGNLPWQWGDGYIEILIGGKLQPESGLLLSQSVVARLLKSVVDLHPGSGIQRETFAEKIYHKLRGELPKEFKLHLKLRLAHDYHFLLQDLSGSPLSA
jgi:6-pyruvoyl-tetrahydropterin synthase